MKELSHNPTVGVSELQTSGKVDQYEHYALFFIKIFPESPLRANLNEGLPDVLLISVDEVVRSLSQFEFNQSNMDPSSSIIPDQAVVGTYTQEDLDLESLPTTPLGEIIVEEQITS